MLNKTIISLITTFTILALVLVGTSWTNTIYIAPAVAQSRDTNQLSLASSLTMLEAWDIFETYSQKENQQFSIALIQSIDTPEDTQQSGFDGRRRGWIGVLLNQSSTLWLTIVDGKIVDRTEQPLSLDLSVLDRPTMDSPEALAVAQTAKPQFEGSTDKKGQGFHFVFASVGGQPTISVLGMATGWTARVQIEPRNGLVLSTQIYTYAPVGGILYSPDSGNTWLASTLNNRMVMAISPDPRQIDWAYAVTAEVNGIGLYRTQDGGMSWKLMGYLPPEAENWPFDLLVMQIPSSEMLFLVGTRNGLWFSLDGTSWKQAPTLSGSVQWLASITSGDEYQILATVSSGERRGLYSTRNFAEWEWIRVSETIYRLSESFDKQMVIAVNEEQPGNGFLLDIVTSQEVMLPKGVLYFAGDFQGESPAIAYSPLSGVGMLEKIDSNIEWSLPVRVASLAVTPDFTESQVGIAGGFRTGLYRTQDGGRHWEQVIQKPSDILPGNDEIYAVAFLSPTAVIAIQGGGFAWQDF